MKIIKNFLNKEDFNNLKLFLFGQNCNWYYKEHMTYTDNPFFNHCFYNYHSPRSDRFDLVLPLIKKLNINAIIQIRANLILSKESHFYSDIHTDVKNLNSKTAIYYLNTCNGATVIKDKKILSVENQILIFDSNTEHQMMSQTDISTRIVINLNYY